MAQPPSLDVMLMEYTNCCIGPATEFMPRDTLLNLITEANVMSTLGIQEGAWNRTFRPQKHLADLNLVKLVVEEARATFAILVILQLSQFTKSLLIEEGLRDEHLPLSIDHEYPNCTSSDGDRKIPFVNWSKGDLIKFVKHHQWFFLAPVLRNTGETIKLHEKCPLPFISDGDEDPAKGGGGLVYKARVHPAHQEGFEVRILLIDPLRNSSMYPIKTFFRRKQQDFGLLSRSFTEKSCSDKKMRSSNKSKT